MYLNDGTTDAPKLRLYLNLDNLADLRADSLFPPHLLAPDAIAARDARLAADGFEGVQLTKDLTLLAGPDLPFCGLDRISLPGEADPIIQGHADRGDQCLTLHVGWGLEDDADAHRLIESILTAADKHRLPTFIETHRATLTQDMWRTVQLTKTFPEIRFNGDFSHYYCGQEMPYGGMEMKLAFLQPVFDRIGFMHGRIAAPGWMQAPIGPELDARPEAATGQGDYLADFRQLWTHAMRGFRQNAGPGDVLVFAPELLAGTHYYARKFPDASGHPTEETDRYAQALLYRDLARECWQSAL